MRESKPVRTRTRSRLPNFIAAALFLLLPLAATAQISLSTAVDLAEKSSPSVRAAVANVQKATAALAETKDAYIPNFVLGASPGYAYGFPFGYPSFFSANLTFARAFLLPARLHPRRARRRSTAPISP